MGVKLPLTRDALVQAQKDDASLATCFAAVVDGNDTCGKKQSYVLRNGLLVRNPTELVFGHNVRGPLKVLQEQFMSGVPSDSNVLDFVSKCQARLHRATSLAREALSSSQGSMKKWFDRKAVVRRFEPGDQVLVLLPVPGSALTARFLGPYVVKQQVSDTDYIILTPERRKKTRLCHVNMLKPYFSRDTSTKERPPEVSASLVCSDGVPDDVFLNMPSGGQQNGRLSNSEFLSDVNGRLSYLSDDQRTDVIQLLQSFPTLFSDVPSCTNVWRHDIDWLRLLPRVVQKFLLCGPSSASVLLKLPSLSFVVIVSPITNQEVITRGEEHLSRRGWTLLAACELCVGVELS
ncbi:hypothetical protein N1851_026963 [Merluccius polli]|uniref:Integrase p58-like C-terminal domain-containing protein n=1 Tax=Merluccius polli TaxID=89951 RepID=A0AA47NTK3_MERPO|nr:hypothetical protein N1851_026963 [Merluccius polli]